MQGLGRGKGGAIRQKQKPKERKDYGVQALINLRKALDPNQNLIPKAVFDRVLRFVYFHYFSLVLQLKFFSLASPSSLVSLLS